MQHEDRTRDYGDYEGGGSEGEDRLTTEDLARPGEDVRTDSDEPAMYPGEATPGGQDKDTTEATTGEPAGEGGSAPRPDESTEEAARPQENEPLLASEEAEELRVQWQKIQTGFVDDPRDSVRAADQLVAEVMQTLAKSFAAHKEGLEGQWDRGEEVPTEDLRVALQRYRSFFNRLLSA